MMDIVVVFCLFEDKILLLKRAENKPESLKWTAPSGKKDLGETVSQAAIRELFEETGIQVSEAETLAEKGSFEHEYPDYSIMIHLFLYNLNTLPNVKLRNEEHSDFCWVTPSDALALPIMDGADECIAKVFSI